MKEAADATLAEVRRKISETNSCMKLIGQLRKLRQLRKDQAERKGLSRHILSSSSYCTSLLSSSLLVLYETNLFTATVKMPCLATFPLARQ